MTNKIFKSAILDFSVSAQNAKANVPLIRFNTQDSGGTARLVFSVKKEGDSLPFSSAAEITLAMVMSVGEEYESKYVVNPVITNRTKGIFEYSLTDDQISHNGQVNAELYVKYPNQSMQINRFNFEIEKAMIDDNFSPLTTYYVKRWDDYEKIFDESFERLNAKLDDVDKKADDLKTQFDAMQPSQFAQKTDLNAHVNDADIHVTATDKTNWNAKETVEGAQAKADKALADAKIDASAKAAQALVDSKAYTDSKITQTVWTGSFNMSASQTVTPSIPLSQCKAWIIYWSKYSAGVARDYYWCTQVVTKETYGGHNFDAMMDNSPVHKYLYVSATQLTGSDDNSTGTNNQAVMRKVVALL
ncbi:phage baseplate upper protein [Listeria monocytogenes]|nr:phage baseplate upper protein [Listeria monocytogenes]